MYSLLGSGESKLEVGRFYKQLPIKLQTHPASWHEKRVMLVIIMGW